jgi:acyl-CoA synthetase (AMP-forming)/AMP-acid ligase II
MVGYHNDPDQTATTKVDGWIHTGDLGELDSDGNLYYRGREKNMVKRSGENIATEEVEGVIQSHDDVVEVVAFGVPDKLRLEELAVSVVLREGTDVQPPAICELVENTIARWKAPRYVRLGSEPLPRLHEIGKIDRRRVAREFDPSEYWDREQHPAIAG